MRKYVQDDGAGAERLTSCQVAIQALLLLKRVPWREIIFLFRITSGGCAKIINVKRFQSAIQEFDRDADLLISAVMASPKVLRRFRSLSSMITHACMTLGTPFMASI